MKAWVVAMIVVVGLVASPTYARQPQKVPLTGEGEGLKLIANVPYNGGTDFEFVEIKGRDYAITGGLGDVPGMRIIDVTDPKNPALTALLPCVMSQMDIQISSDQKTAIMAADSAAGPDGCLMVGRLGFMTVDISDPSKPKPLGVADIPRGSHNTTAHPKKPFVWNSDSDVGGRGEIQIWSIKNPKKPKLVNTVLSLPHSPHDITFTDDGKMAATASVSHIDLWDTTDPANPTLLFETQCPGCTITHDIKFTPDSTVLVAGDEAGGGMGVPCPGGAVYFYSVVPTPATTVLVPKGIYEPGELVFARDGQTGLGSCTSHVMDISPDGTHLAVSWYTAGTRYLDMTAFTGATFGDTTTGGVIEEGWFMPDGGTSWASKFHKGPYIYSNDLGRGFDVFKIEE